MFQYLGSQAFDISLLQRSRVSQNWAGKGWGGMVIPRIGMEVVVEFLEGDPDKPLVTGCVYNGKNDVPYELPKHKTRSTLRSNTHGPGEWGFNELRFEDEKGREEIYSHAERDRRTFTKKDVFSFTCGRSVHKFMKNVFSIFSSSRAAYIERDDAEIISGSKMVKIGPGNSNPTLSSRQFMDAYATVRSLDRLHVSGNSFPSAGDYSLDAEGGISFTSDFGQSFLTAGATSIDSDGPIRLSTASGKSEFVQGSSISYVSQSTVLSSGEAIELRCGASSISIGPDSISLSSPRIDLN